jgi:hypothetical protein
MWFCFPDEFHVQENANQESIEEYETDNPFTWIAEKKKDFIIYLPRFYFELIGIH